MGFLDKAKKAVATAKDELDKSGLLEQFRGDDDAAPEVPTRDHTSDMIDSIRRGAVDPRTLLTVADVEAVAGHEVRDPEVGFNGDFVSAFFRGGDECYTLSCFHAIEDDYPWNPESQWEDLLQGHDESCVDLPGLGERAYRQGNMVFAMANGRVLYSEVTGDTLHEDAQGVRAAALMRSAVRRL